MGDAYFDKLQLLLPMKGTDGSTVFTDYSKYKRYVYRAGGTLPVIETDRYAHANYGSSGYFPYNGSGQPAHLRLNGINIGTQPFTFSCWLGQVDGGIPRDLFDCRYASEAFSAVSNNASGGFCIRYDDEVASLIFTYGAAASEITAQYTASPYTPFTNAVKYGWGHFEVSRDSSNNLRLFMNGILFATQANVTNSFNYKSCTIGGRIETTNREAVYMTDVALHVGVALHTGNFTHELRRRTGYALSGTVLDDTGSGAIRTVAAHSRLAPESVSVTQSAANGAYSFADLVDDDHYVVCLDDNSGTTYNALVLDRITPT